MLLTKGEPFRVRTRPTPKPGPGELLIAVKAVALNPADYLIQDFGLFIQNYPTVLGFDVAGLVVDVGEKVPSDTFQPGVTRVAGYAAFAWKSQGADYGAFQERCIIPWQHVVPLHGHEMSWIRAATLPVAVQVPLMAWEALGIPLVGASTIAAAEQSFENSIGSVDENSPQQQTPREALLIWGASSSVGTMGVQTACLLRDDITSPINKVYATANSSNHKYIRSLGADRVFDYHDPDVVDAIVSEARADGLVIRHCFLAMGAIQPCQSVIKSFIQESDNDEKKWTIASAPPIPTDSAAIEGITTVFLEPYASETERLTQFQFCMDCLEKSLIKGSIRPSPEPKVVGKGLLAINEGLSMLRYGVSCTKLVVDLDD
ncbi:GroES-like protein [Curvularia clavata]|uniref:GroES-like protein n=1 Tax=Curvularia clavata TaxID=95742 RepID=A0A9Q8ZDJ4_CURCL|nr:GroES-like protein [Curvularia clavata]